ncbi:MAG: LiaF domain-containing protein [Treponemataceae bacterium]
MTETEQVESRKKVAIDRLTERYSHDELPMDEYERLVADIHRASSARELAVVEDIVGGKIDAAPSNGAGNASAQNRDAENGFLSEDLVQSCVVILSERTYRGNWLRKPNIAAEAVLGSQLFDFTETELPAGQTLLEAVAVLGSIDIIVPEGVAVRIDVAPILGEVKVARGVDTSEKSGKPLLVITGNAILGSVSVRLG